MDLESTVNKARPHTKSLRATIPLGVVSFLGIEDGDKLFWRMEIKGGKKVVIIRT